MTEAGRQSPSTRRVPGLGVGWDNRPFPDAKVRPQPNVDTDNRVTMCRPSEENH